MSEPRNAEIDDLRSRLQDLIERTDIGHDARELAAEALEELAVVVEEIQTQNSELIDSRSTLEHERQRYRELFETIPDGYVITDAQGLIIEANATACELFGKPRTQLVGTPLSARIAAADQRTFYAQLSQILRAGAGGSLTINLAIRDHVTLPANLRATILQSAINGETEVRWIIHDRRAEISGDETRVNEERLRSLFETAGVGVILSDTSGAVVFANVQADELLARRPEATALDEWTENVHGDDAVDLSRMIRSAVTNGESSSLRHRIHSGSDERWVDHTLVPFRAADGTVNGCVSTLADVTIEHNVQLNLEASRDFTVALLDTVGALVVVLDRDGIIQRFNKSL